ncbi:MAG: hypothetical protein IH991_13245 [Planctomycetes bacterium]|nr:hypothetical protein [Planctomycetota bacterium]
MKELPSKGFVFWPVGTGDSTTVCVDDEVVMQIDLHDLDAADDEDDPRTSIVDRLVELLPQKDGKPYLSVFVLTHPDLDHCKGFKDVREKVTIGEIWFAPRIFRENASDLCDDAKDFRKEAKRRVKVTREADDEVEAGDRVRVIGYSDLLDDDDFDGFPEERLTPPGNTITELDGEDHEGDFEAFVHSPFKDDDTASERNETSVGLRIELCDDEEVGRGLFLGDLSYPTLRRVWDESRDHDNKDKVDCDVFLSPHQCSKSVMYQKNDDGDEELKQDILDDIEKSLADGGYIIASCDPVPTKNKKGDNPPHAKAKARYEEIVADGHFLCTGEHSDKDDPKEIVFEFTNDGFEYVEPEDESDDDSDDESESESARTSASLAAAIGASQGSDAPPTQRVGFGRSE